MARLIGEIITSQWKYAWVDNTDIWEKTVAPESCVESVVRSHIQDDAAVIQHKTTNALQFRKVEYISSTPSQEVPSLQGIFLRVSHSF